MLWLATGVCVCVCVCVCLCVCVLPLYAIDSRSQHIELECVRIDSRTWSGQLPGPSMEKILEVLIVESNVVVSATNR